MAGFHLWRLLPLTGCDADPLASALLNGGTYSVGKTPLICAPDQQVVVQPKSSGQDSAPRSRRILCVLRWPVGGIRSYIRYNYPRLVERGYRLTIVGPDDQSFVSLSGEIGHWEGSEFVRAALSGGRCLLGRSVRRELRTGRYSILHSHGFTAATQSVLANLGIGVPHVFTAHYVIQPERFPGWRGRWMLRAIGLLVERIDRFIAISEDARRNYLEHLPGLARRPERVVTIPNGIDVDRFGELPPWGNADLRGRLGAGPGTVLVGYLGRFMEEKGFLVLVEALRRMADRPPLRDYRVVAVGSGDFEREYREEVERQGLSEVVCFQEFVPDVAPLLAGLDLVVVPSLSETCPLLPMEAMAAGVPVLGTDCIGLREVLAGTPSVVIPRGDAEILGSALRSAIEAPWTAVAQRYAPEARRRFSIDRAVAALDAVFEELIQGIPPGRG
ncbi:MAG: glycosyltransferase family 4 protein [Isosphaeraceae bacterium]